MPPELRGLPALLEAVRGGRDALAQNADVLDALNVFPVPDGDTGRNLLYTMRAGVADLERQPPATFRELADRLGASLTRDSRGNSGFLLSAFFAEFLEVIAAAGDFDGAALVGAFSAGADAARTALAAPREGTFLTATSHMAEALRLAHPGSVEALLAQACEAGRDAVRVTPDLLPLLRRAGVVDAGALGFVTMIEGMRAVLAGPSLRPLVESDHRFEPAAGEGDVEPDPLARPYCTQLLVEVSDRSSIDLLREWLLEHGESVVLLERDGRLKLHVHSDRPEEVATRAAEVGTVLERRVEDMREQIRQKGAVNVAGSVAVATPAGVLAVVPGRGFGGLFRELGASRILEYDRDLPSVQQLTDAVEALDARSVILLTNDPNLVAAAGRVAGLLPDRSVNVIPTTSPVAGIAAMYGYDPTAPARANLRTMAESCRLVDALAVHRSVRDLHYGAAMIRRGDCFVLRGDDLVAVAEDIARALAAAVVSAGGEGRSSISLYWGQEVEGDFARGLLTHLRERFSELQVEGFDGGQRRPLLWVALE